MAPRTRERAAPLASSWLLALSLTHTRLRAEFGAGETGGGGFAAAAALNLPEAAKCALKRQPGALGGGRAHRAP